MVVEGGRIDLRVGQYLTGAVDEREADFSRFPHLLGEALKGRRIVEPARRGFQHGRVLLHLPGHVVLQPVEKHLAE